MSGNDTLSKPDMERRITASCKDVAGAIAGLCYIWDDGTKQMTLAGVDAVFHARCVVSAAKDVQTTFDTGGIQRFVASGQILLGGEVQIAASGKVKAQAGGKPRLGYAFSHAEDGEQVSVLVTR